MSDELISQLRNGGILYVLLVIAITMREFGRAWVADKCGCVLPRMQGRLTINPLAHMDMLGTVIFPILCIGLASGTGFPLIFGWGKPVETVFTNPKTRVRDEVLSALGGPCMNLVVAFVSSVFLAVFAAFKMQEYASVAYFSIMINAVIFILNMLPIPPLDGARIVKFLFNVPDSVYNAVGRYGILIFFAVIFLPPPKHVLAFLITWVCGIFEMIAGIISSLFVK